MDEKLNQLMKNCKPNETIEINPRTGEVFIIGGKSGKQKAGNLFKFADEIIPLNAKPWASVFNSGGFDNYRDFGKQENHKKDYDSDIIIGLFESALQLQDNIIMGNFQDNNYKYSTKTVNKLIGYYDKANKLRFVEFQGIKYYKQPEKHNLSTQVFSAWKD